MKCLYFIYSAIIWRDETWIASWFATIQREQSEIATAKRIASEAKMWYENVLCRRTATTIEIFKDYRRFAASVKARQWRRQQWRISRKSCAHWQSFIFDELIFIVSLWWQWFIWEQTIESISICTAHTGHLIIVHVIIVIGADSFIIISRSSRT